MEGFQAHGWVDTYLIHKEYRISPFLLQETCNKFAEQKILDIEGRMFRVTQDGRAWIIKNRAKLFSSNRPWARPSPHLIAERKSPTEPYLPDLKLLDKDFFLSILPEKKE